MTSNETIKPAEAIRRAIIIRLYGGPAGKPAIISTDTIALDTDIPAERIPEILGRSLESYLRIGAHHRGMVDRQFILRGGLRRAEFIETTLATGLKLAGSIGLAAVTIAKVTASGGYASGAMLGLFVDDDTLRNSIAIRAHEHTENSPIVGEAIALRLPAIRPLNRKQRQAALMALAELKPSR